MPFCKSGLFRMGFWQNVHVEDGPVAAVCIGRVRLRGHGKKTVVQVSHKLLSQKPEGNACDHKLPPKGKQKKHAALTLPRGQGDILDLNVTPLTPRLITPPKFLLPSP